MAPGIDRSDLSGKALTGKAKMKRETLTERAKAYLRTVEDWKADYEIAILLGDAPPPANSVVRSMMGRLIGRGLVTWGRCNNTYRITDAGRQALAEREGMEP